MKVLRQDPLASIFLNLVLKKYGELPPTYQVVGFDDSPIASEYLIPFSTIHQQIDVLTKEAMDILVMQMKNRDFASNGDIGYICTSTQGEDGLLVEVDFGDDRVVAYEDIEALRQLELAYATTIHKSQGSEYDAVLINIQDMHGKMLNRALFYTAETRAKKRVIIVGDWDAVVRAIQTADTKRRHTMLAMRINELTKE